MLIEEFYAFINERENIRLRKEGGFPKPWTQDEVLQNYKFTNVFRKHDRTTVELRKRFYEKHYGQSSPEKIVLLNCAIARYFGTWEFMQAVGWQTKFDPELLKAVATERLKNKQRVFTGAYIITNQGIKAPKQDVVVDVFLTELWKAAEELVEIAMLTCSWEQTTEAMQRIQGFGGTGFMAKEILLDTMFCDFWKTDSGKPLDYWSWTPLGPGSLRGAARVVEKPKVDAIRCRAIIRDISDHQDELWNHSVDAPLCPHDIQFQLCEFDKYLRVKNGEGRPRSKYNGSS